MHPEQPGYSVDREAFERIWFHSVDLLQRGFKSGSILTVDPEDAEKLGKPWTRRRAILPLYHVKLLVQAPGCAISGLQLHLLA